MRVALAGYTLDDAEAYIYRDEQLKAERRLDRERKGRSGWRRGAPQCFSCRRVLSGRGADCPACGGHAPK